MRMNLSLSILCGLAVVAAPSAATARTPNIVVILADDLGYADLGCYGNTAGSTPHLDCLAREGIRFTDFHANGPMCSPTRAALLTGRYPQRVAIEAALPLMAFPARREGLPASTQTLPGALQRAGYATAMFGKWHLGHHPEEHPVRFGFQEFRGLLCGDGDYAAQISRNGLPDWWHNEKLVPPDTPANTTTLITDEATQFIERHHGRPFFLYVAHLGIHFPWMRPDDPPHRRLGTPSLGTENPADSKLGPHVGSERVRSVVQEMIADLDHSVGRIVETLRRLGLAENTLVVFTSDNGGYTDYQGLHTGEISSNAPFRAGKTSLYEGGHRVPAIAWWPGTIAPGRVSHATALTMDLLPTTLELADLPRSTMADQPPDGVSLVPLLLRDESLPGRTVFWRFRRTVAARSGPWKLLLNAEQPELYYLTDDPAESRNRADTEMEIVARLRRAAADWAGDVDGSFASLLSTDPSARRAR